MSNFKFKLNYEGVGELLRSPEMAVVVGEYTEKAAAEVGGEGHVFMGRNRYHGWVDVPNAESDQKKSSK